MARLASASALLFLRTLIGPERDVLEDRLVREEVEGLEDHADVGAQVGQRLALLGKLLAVDGDRAGLVGLEPVDRAAERGLPRPRGADEDDDLALADREVDVLEDVEVAEVFVDPRDDDHRLLGGRGGEWGFVPLCWPSGGILVPRCLGHSLNLASHHAFGQGTSRAFRIAVTWATQAHSHRNKKAKHRRVCCAAGADLRTQTGGLPVREAPCVVVRSRR
jgi:hypothetical protein